MAYNVAEKGILLAEGATADQIVILEKMGFTSLQHARFFNGMQERNPELKKLFKKHEAGMASNSSYDSLLKAVGGRLRREGTIVDFDPALVPNGVTILDKLNKDIKANQGAAKRLDEVFAKPSAQALNTIAGKVDKYNTNQLDQILTEAAGAPSGSAATTSQKAQARPNPPSNAQPLQPAANAQNNQVNNPSQQGAGYQRNAGASYAAPTPSSTPAAPATPQQQAPATPPPQQQASTVAKTPSGPPPTALDILAESSDEDIADMLSKDLGMVKEIEKAIIETAEKNYPATIGSESSIKGFKDRLEATGLRSDIAKNLAENPGVVRDIAKFMKEAEEGDNPLVSNMVRENLGKIIENPEGTLASKKWIDDLKRGLSGEDNNLMGGVFSFLKTYLNIDLSGFGAMFQGFFQGIGHFFNQFSGGNFLLMGNLDPNKSLFTKLGESMDNARFFSEREQQLLPISEAVARPGAGGQVSDGYTRDPSGRVRRADDALDKNGNIVKAGEGKELYDSKNDHRIAIRTINQGDHKIYITDNLHPQRERTGDYTWTFVTEVDAKGQPARLGQFVMSAEESRHIFAEMKRAGVRNVTDPDTMHTWDPEASRVARAQQEPPRNTINVDPQTGQTSPQRAPQPENFPPAPSTPPFQKSPQARGATPNFSPDPLPLAGS